MSNPIKEELLALHAGGDLSVSEAAEVEAHVLECEASAELLESYRRSREALCSLREELPASDSLWSDIEARLDVVDAASRHRVPWYARYRYLAPASMAAALLIAVQFLGGDPVQEVVPGDGDPSIVKEEKPDPGLRPASSEELQRLLYSPYVESGEADGLVSQQASADF